MDMERIYLEHGRMVYCYLLSLTQDPDLAEELTQETFCQAIQNARRFRGESRVSTWLCAIARNQWGKYRAKHPPTEELQELPGEHRAPEETVLSEIGHTQLMKKLHQLPEPYREVLYMRLFGGLSFQKIGEIMEMSENWARVTYYRGKVRLRKEVMEDEK